MLLAPGIPMVAFFVLLVVGVWLEELEVKHGVILAAVWFLGLTLFHYFGLPRGAYVCVEALLACVLVLKIFGGNIRMR